MKLFISLGQPGVCFSIFCLTVFQSLMGWGYQQQQSHAELAGASASVHPVLFKQQNHSYGDEQESNDSFQWMFGDLIGENGEGDFSQSELPIVDDSETGMLTPEIWVSVDGFLQLFFSLPSYRVPPPKIREYEARPLQIRVFKSIEERGYQFLTLHFNNEFKFLAPVSTAWERLAKAKRGSYFAVTPPGIFAPDSIETKRFSNRWQVMLPYVIRFNNGIWIHATTPDHYHELGFPASGGCVRLHLEDAKIVYQWVKDVGLNKTVIMVYPHRPHELQLPRHLQKKQLPLPSDFLEWRQLRQIGVP